MIVGIGIDLVDVARMERALAARAGERFIVRVFASEEIDVCRGAPKPAESFAARFAAKEAISKALGTGFSQGIAPNMIVVKGGERTKPTIELRGEALILARSLNVRAIHISLSHVRGLACAYGVLES